MSRFFLKKMDLTVKQKDGITDTSVVPDKFPAGVAFIGVLEENAYEGTLEDAFENRGEEMPEDIVASEWAEICVSGSLDGEYFVADMKKCLLNKKTGEVMDEDPEAVSMMPVSIQDCQLIITAKTPNVQINIQEVLHG